MIQRASERRIGQHQRVAFFLGSVFLSQRVAVDDVGILHAVQQHVHTADPQHRAVEVEAVEHVAMEVLFQLGIAEDFGMFFTQVPTVDVDCKAMQSGALQTARLRQKRRWEQSRLIPPGTLPEHVAKRDGTCKLSAICRRRASASNATTELNHSNRLNLRPGE